MVALSSTSTLTCAPHAMHVLLAGYQLALRQLQQPRLSTVTDVRGDNYTLQLSLTTLDDHCNETLHSQLIRQLVPAEPGNASGVDFMLGGLYGPFLEQDSHAASSAGRVMLSANPFPPTLLQEV